MVYKKGHNPWNTYLTKETDPRLKIMGEKISKANKGREPWNKTQTKETDPRIAKYAAKLIGQPSPRKGVHLSDETKHKIRLKRLEKYTGEDNPFYGKHHTQETKIRMRERWRERIAKGFEVWNKNKPMSEKHRVNNTISVTRFYNTPEGRAIQRRRATIARGKYPQTNTSIEISLQEFLKKRGTQFETDKPLLGVTKVDIFIEPNICVYADGDYWHNYPKGIENDRRIAKILKERDYKVLRFWGSEIRESLDECIKKILEAIEN